MQEAARGHRLLEARPPPWWSRRGCARPAAGPGSPCRRRPRGRAGEGACRAPRSARAPAAPRRPAGRCPATCIDQAPAASTTAPAGDAPRLVIHADHPAALDGDAPDLPLHEAGAGAGRRGVERAPEQPRIDRGLRREADRAAGLGREPRLEPAGGVAVEHLHVEAGPLELAARPASTGVKRSSTDTSSVPPAAEAHPGAGEPLHLLGEVLPARERLHAQIVKGSRLGLHARGEDPAGGAGGLRAGDAALEHDHAHARPGRGAGPPRSPGGPRRRGRRPCSCSAP